MGARIDQEKKEEIIAFITKFNQDNGGGGQAAAMREYGVSPKSLSIWMSQKRNGQPNPRPEAIADQGATSKRGPVSIDVRTTRGAQSPKKAEKDVLRNADQSKLKPREIIDTVLLRNSVEKIDACKQQIESLYLEIESETAKMKKLLAA